MSEFRAQDKSGNFTGTTWRGILATLLLFSAIATVLTITALSFEFLNEELAKAYVIPILVGAMFTSLTTCVIIAKYRSEELY